MIIYLMGYMGSGKSTLGKKLARRLYFRFIDLDNHIEEKEGLKIAELFERYGEEEFRCKETKYLSELSLKDDLVVALGGGTPCFNMNIDIIRQTGLSIYLQLPVKALVHRLIHSTKARPLISGMNADQLQEYIIAHLAEREPYYKKADHIVEGLNNSFYKVMHLISSRQQIQSEHRKSK